MNGRNTFEAQVRGYCNWVLLTHGCEVVPWEANATLLLERDAYSDYLERGHKVRLYVLGPNKKVYSQEIQLLEFVPNVRVTDRYTIVDGWITPKNGGAAFRKIDIASMVLVEDFEVEK